MLNDLHHRDSRFATERPLKGGVAPSRYDLALHAYVEKQRHLAQGAPAIDAGAVRTFLVSIAGFCTALVARNHTPKSRQTVASR